VAREVKLPDNAWSQTLYNQLSLAGIDFETLTQKAVGYWSHYITPTDKLIMYCVFRDLDTPATPAEIRDITVYINVFRDAGARYPWIYTTGTGDYLFRTGWFFANDEATDTVYQASANARFRTDESEWKIDNFTTSYSTSDGNSVYGDRATTNLYILASTVDVYWSGQHYTPTPPDERIFAKQVGTYKMNVGVRANSESERASGSYVYNTKTYNINIKWVSPVSGHSFTMSLNNLIYNTAFTTAPPLFPAYNFSTAGATGNRARALRMPLGAYALVTDIPTDFADMSDVGAVSEISLTELKNYASTQYSGITNNDVFTEITAEFVDVATSQIVETKTLDYSSLFGEDIDINGSTFPSPNDDENITDDLAILFLVATSYFSFRLIVTKMIFNKTNVKEVDSCSVQTAETK
jgi:hypothetical protein